MTIAGLHTAHELSDLLDGKRSNVADLSTAVEAAIGAVDTTGDAWMAWLQRYSTFLNNWNAVTATAQTLVDNDKSSLTGWDYSTEETEWGKVLDAIAPLGDLDRDFRALPANPQAGYVGNPTPQPSAPDTDLNALNGLNAAPVVGSGGLVDNVVAKAESLTGPGTGTYWLVGGTIVGTLAALFIAKRLL